MLLQVLHLVMTLQANQWSVLCKHRHISVRFFASDIAPSTERHHHWLRWTSWTLKKSNTSVRISCQRITATYTWFCHIRAASSRYDWVDHCNEAAEWRFFCIFDCQTLNGNTSRILSISSAHQIAKRLVSRNISSYFQLTAKYPNSINKWICNNRDGSTCSSPNRHEQYELLKYNCLRSCSADRNLTMRRQHTSPFEHNEL